MPHGRCSFLMIKGVPVVTAPAAIDITTAGQLRAILAERAARGYATLLVDMTGTQFCDSSGLSVLVRAHKNALAQGGGLGLILPASGTIPHVFTLTGLDQVIPQFASLEQALAEAPATIWQRRPGRSPATRSLAECNGPGRGPEAADDPEVNWHGRSKATGSGG
jgi:anti-sigma B factor antagonist